jgi:hypothetical protein
LASKITCAEQILKSLVVVQDTVDRRTEMIRALVPACISIQVPIKMGIKLVARTAALFWSPDHVFCQFEVGMSPPPLPQTLQPTTLPHTALIFLRSSVCRVLMVALFLLQWLCAVEESGLDAITEEENKVYTLLRDLLAEASPDTDSEEERVSMRFLTYRSYLFGGVNVWGSIFIRWR